MAEMGREDVKRKLLSFSQDCKDLFIPHNVPYLDSPPNPLQFYREYVAQNKPVIIKNALSHWPALAKWTNEYLKSKLKDAEVSVSVTPDGYADAVVENIFVTPLELQMKFYDFLLTFNGQIPSNFPEGVYYIQKQNSNFTSEEYSIIQNDTEDHIPWATEAFGKLPDAVNFWMGEERAVTSMHKDHYENMYCVIRGSKTFILHPPTDRPFIPHGNYEQGCYKVDDKNSFFIEKCSSELSIPWVCIDPLKPDLESFPDYVNTHTIKCTIQAGELLYLPSLWFHHVQQAHGTIAINFWYDMEYGMDYCYYKLIENLIL